MGIQDHIDLPDFAAADTNQDGLLSEHESLALVDLTKEPNTREQILDSSIQLEDALGVLCDGNNLPQIFGSSTPNRIDVDAHAMKAARDYLKAELPEKADIVDLVYTQKQNGHTFDNKEYTLLGTNASEFHELANQFDASVNDARDIISTWQQTQDDALGGIELADNEAFCNRGAEVLGNLKTQYNELATQQAGARSPAD